MLNDNIAAIATAQGAAGVAVIRISGDSPLNVAEKVFSPIGKTSVKDFEPYKMYVGEIIADGFCDFGMCVYFKAPKSFTGEDVVELHSHGGAAIVRGILKKVLSCGARLAERGEFTKRAFMNGKLSLSSAEGLIDMINSESESGVRAGYSLYRERLTEKVNAMQDELLDALSQIDVDMDFPEEDLETTSRESVKKTLKDAAEKTDALISSFKTGRVLKNGVKVAIAGKPNTGKSSLLNALLNYDKAIVSDVAGTTRDVVEGSIDINGVRFNFYDTAGIRETSDKIENLGVELSEKTVKACDVVLFLADGGAMDETDEKIYSFVKDRNLVFAINKTDVSDYKDERADIYVSALNGDNIEKLKELLYERAVGSVDLNADYLCEERHLSALKKAREKIGEAVSALDFETLDIISIDVKAAWDALGEITGKTATEEIINNIFMKFCVGK